MLKMNRQQLVFPFQTSSCLRFQATKFNYTIAWLQDLLPCLSEPLLYVRKVVFKKITPTKGIISQPKTQTLILS